MTFDTTPISIFYADDDLDDQMTFTDILRMLPFPVQPVFFTNGLSLYQQLLESLAINALPLCMVLDINMPIWDGIKTLQTIRADLRFANVPLVMFTTSQSVREKEKCLELGANAFFTKPDNHFDYRHIAAELIKLTNG